ncbi:hypothetical protein AB0J42_36665 [Nonomuraea sp. NPDC049649]|uniref:hypothetical protein n=1 Tax=Nonomuraea sp. NPDC049649 TaxID=3155776 RepID=UPI0034438928
MKFLRERFPTIALTKYPIKVSSSIDQIGEGSAFEVECGHAMLYGRVEVATPGVQGRCVLDW